VAIEFQRRASFTALLSDAPGRLSLPNAGSVCAPSRKPALRAYGFRKRTLRFSACPRQGCRPGKVRQQRRM